MVDEKKPHRGNAYLSLGQTDIWVVFSLPFLPLWKTKGPTGWGLGASTWTHWGWVFY